MAYSIFMVLDKAYHVPKYYIHDFREGRSRSNNFPTLDKASWTPNNFVVLDKTYHVPISSMISDKAYHIPNISMILEKAY